MKISLFSLVWVPAFVGVGAHARVVRYERPILGPQVVRDSGVGIHFTTSYVTAAVRYENGTVEDLVRVQGDADYISLIVRWSDFRSRSNNPGPVQPIERTLGDAETLSSFLRTIKDAVEEKLGSPITDAMPAFPPLLDHEHTAAVVIEEAFQKAGLTWVRTDRHVGTHDEALLSEMNAAYAGLGYGLCESWTDAARCEKEENAMPFQYTLYVNFDNASFSVTQCSPRNALEERCSALFLSMEHGWWNLPVEGEPRVQFWATMQDHISVIGGDRLNPPSKVILLGDHADEEEFVQVVKDGMWEGLEYDVSVLLEANDGVDMKTVAARGAAELAFRVKRWSRDSRSVAEVESESRPVLEVEEESEENVELR